MQHDFSIVFDTDNEYWQRVLDIFAANESYPKKIVSNRNLHHKFPKSFSKILGEQVDNDKENLISLSHADHFLVHYYYYLLAKKGFRQPMALAFRMMTRKCIKYITPDTAEEMANDYEEAVEISRQYISQSHKGKKFSDEHRRKLSEAHKGIPLTDECRRHMSEVRKGHTITDETRKKISEANKGKSSWNKGLHNIYSDETRKKKSEAMKGENNPMHGRTGEKNPLFGTHLSEEQRKKISEAAKKRAARKRKKAEELIAELI